MFKRTMRKIRRARIDRLARQALKLAADEYESGTFQWVAWQELSRLNGMRIDYVNPRASMDLEEALRDNRHDADPYLEDVSEVYQKANAGCALGGISRAAWIVAGKPTSKSKDWKLKNEVELLADLLLIRSLGADPEVTVEDGVPHISVAMITGFNDHQVRYKEDPAEVLATQLRLAATQG